MNVHPVDRADTKIELARQERARNRPRQLHTPISLLLQNGAPVTGAHRP